MTSYASRCKVIAGICVRRTLPLHALLASLLLLGGLLLMRPAYFEADMVKSFAEVLCPCAGLLLLTPLFLPERPCMHGGDPRPFSPLPAPSA